VWPDNETDRDLLNFEGVADTVAETITQANGRPISIGISGAWGVGKSSMIKLTRGALERRQPENEPPKFVFVEFNAWLYQGYDDARAALMEVIAERLSDVANERKTGVEKAQEFLGRVRWLRVAKLVAIPTVAALMGLPPVGLVGELDGIAKEVATGEADGDTLARAGAATSSLAKIGRTLLDPKDETSLPKEIQALRTSFEDTLAVLGITLVVLIDDLDRCLPDTTISTLEAIRLFLFLENTAFVIAADDAMVKHAVKKHFGDLQNDDLVTNYFDKLIQVPIRVPSLGTQEVRAYMMMLFVDNSGLADADKDLIREKIGAQLRQSWKGLRVDKAFLSSLKISLPAPLVARLDTAERLAPLMTTSSAIAGNPRLVKRFLNALSIRMSISNAQGVGVDEAVLAKLLLFERLAPSAAYQELATSVNTDSDGKPTLLSSWEAAIRDGEIPELAAPWDGTFVREWLGVPPELAGEDLRGALYVSREHAPLISASDRLSSEAAEILSALLTNPAEGSALVDELRVLPKSELSIVMERLLARARQEQSWGVPPILVACIAVTTADPSQGPNLAGFLIERPAGQIEPSIIPKIADQSWAPDVLTAWRGAADIARPVKAAIENQEKNGNLSK
jgi:predicted KAP-like P-loop ATPase